MFNEWNLAAGCRKFYSRFEDYLGGAQDYELEAHLSQCERCRLALKDSRLAGDLLRGAREPTSEPSQEFLAGVMARIRQERGRVDAHAAFWAPLEFLASRLSFTAAMVLLVLSGYLVEFAPRRNAPPLIVRTELSASDFPQPPGEPSSNEEVLQSLAETTYGR